jgi:hypothetical protein
MIPALISIVFSALNKQSDLFGGEIVCTDRAVILEKVHATAG